jgi:hypothetical protein
VTPFWFFLLTLAVYRAVRLALYDRITEPLRDWFFLHVAGEAGWRRWVTDLATCQWCLGVHVAFWATLAWSLYDGWWTGWSAVVPFVAVWFALSASQSLVHLIEDWILPE